MVPVKIIAFLALTSISALTASPIDSVSGVGHVVLPKPELVCTAKSCALEGCASSESCEDLIGQCAEVGNCPPDLDCPIKSCELTICSKTPTCVKYKAQEPFCTPATCGAQKCADSEFCVDLIGQCGEVGNCPPDLDCPLQSCELTICSETPTCVNHKVKETSLDKTKRGFRCPHGINCGHGPVCTGFACEDPLCADAPSCKKGPAHKDTITERQIATLPGDGKPQCPHVCNTYPVCICLPDLIAPSCECGIDWDTPTGYELEGECIPSYTDRNYTSICAEVCTKEGFCVCETGPGCTCPANTTNWSPFDLVDAPPNDPVLHMSQNYTQPGQKLPLYLGKDNGTHPHPIIPCPDICDEEGNCGCNVGAGKKKA